MFKRENYSTRALSTFEVIASFIVDLYYNHFYQEAKRIRIEGRVDSITDGYKHAIKAYLKSFESSESYRKTIVGIHKYYYTTTRFSSISFSECVNEIVKHFIPEDFFDSTTHQQRDGILRTVLINSVKQFSSDVLCSNLLDNLIDNHDEPGIVRRMQDKMVQALMFEREKMFQSIFTVTNKTKGGGEFTINMKIKTEMVKLVKENHALTGKYGRLKDKALELLNIVKTQKERLEKLEKLHEPDNHRLEQSERENNRYYDERRRDAYNNHNHNHHNQEQQFDRYRSEQNSGSGGDENKDIILRSENPNMYTRTRRYDRSYTSEPPSEDLIRFAQHSDNSTPVYNTQQYRTLENDDNTPDTHIDDTTTTTDTHIDDNTPDTNIDDTPDTNIDDTPDTNIDNKKENPQYMIKSLSPSDDDFLNDDILNIN
jgi:hypothetical protein